MNPTTQGDFMNDDVRAAETAISEAAIKVMNALQPLSPEERARVLHSAAALYGVSSGPMTSLAAPSNRNVGTAGAVGSAAAIQTTSPGKRLSIVEFLQQREAATNPQRIACFAYYREKVEGSENFAKGDLSDYFPLAKLPAPGSNYSRDYNGAVKEGWIHDEGAKSYLTQKGEAAVEAGFDGKAKPRGATSAKKRRKASKAGKSE